MKQRPETKKPCLDNLHLRPDGHRVNEPTPTMKKKQILIGTTLIALLCTLIHNAEARLGETEAECEARYGKGKEAKLEIGAGLKDEIAIDSLEKTETKEGDDNEAPEEKKDADETTAPKNDEKQGWRAMVYSARGLRIHVVFENDGAVFIKYANEAVFSLDDSAPPTLELTQGEIEHLKKLNAGGGSWKRHEDALLAKTAPMLTVWKSSGGSAYSGYNRERKEFFACGKRFWETVLGQIREQVQQSSLGDASERLRGL